jgi:hypothetical protein
MAPLQGLTGLTPDPQDTTDVMDEGVLEAKANPIAADHADYGSQYNGYQGTVPDASPFSGMPVYEGWTDSDSQQYGGRDYNLQGYADDMTPTTHSSPYPKGIIQPDWSNPSAYATAAEQMRELHGTDLGGVEFYQFTAPAGRETPTNYTTDNYVAPNENYLVTAPDQLKGSYGHGASGQSGLGGGNADTTQGYGVLNTMEEFNAGHSIRRVQHDRMPWDFTATHGEQNVPFYGRHPVQQMPLNGPDSPYFDQGDISGANIVWEGRIGDPSPYVQPPEVTIAPGQPDAPDVWSWG